MERNGVYTITKRVPQQAIDALGHVNNVVYVDWIQEVSKKHWDNKTTPEQREKVFWVVLSHFIEYKSACFAGEVLELRTWVDTVEGTRSERCVEIWRKKDKQLAVKARTSWCLVDAETKRPKRITTELDQIAGKDDGQ